MSDQEQEKNIAQGLSQLGETTTAAELLRQKGQTKKLRVISEKQLMDWILRMLQQHMAGKADAFSDVEKTEMLKKTQDELGRRIKREQEAQAERDRLKAELDAAMAAVSQAGTTSQADIDAAMQGLKEKLEQAEQINLDLQQDNYDLQDQLNEKMALLSTTIAEKDKLRDTVRNQMMRMTALVEGVLGIDNEYYGAKHQEENQVAEEASQDEQFYHDFDIGAKVITTLQADLERLRGITKGNAEAQAQTSGLLASDLELLEQLKSGSLHAVDVAAPVAGLVEAMDGARAEAEAFEAQVAEATGAGHQQTFSELPDASGDAAEVLAGATSVARELAASLARNRNRIAALKAIADESDEARHGTEEDLDATRAALERVCTALRQRAEADRIKVPEALLARDGVPADRAAAANEVIDQLQAASPVEAAAIEQLAITDRLVKSSGAYPIVDPKTTDKHLMAERLRKAGQELERHTLDLQRQLDEAIARERALAERVKSLAIAQASAASGELQLDAKGLPPAVRELERSLEVKADPQFLAEITAKALDEVAGAGGKRAAVQAVFDEDRAIAAEIVRASKGDDRLAESVADLALAADSADAAQQPEVSRLVREAVAALIRAKQEAESHAKAVEERLGSLQAAHGEGSAAVSKALADLDAARSEVQKLQGDALRLRSGRDSAVNALDAITNEIRVRCVGCGKNPRPDLTDRATDPAQRSEAALAALKDITDHRAAESAAIDGVEAIDRALARSGATGGHAAGLVPGDEKRTAAALKDATAALEARIATIADELDAARTRERELAKQVRELSTALSVASPSASPKEEVARLERALAENAGAAELAEATRKVVAGLKAKAGKAEIEARASAARAIAAEVVRAAEGDVELADHVADLSLAIENPESDLAQIEGMVREAVVRLGSRRRAAEAERARLAGEIGKREARVVEHGAETTRLSNEGSKLKAQNVALTAALAQLTSELRSRATELGRDVPAVLSDPAADSDARARAGLEVLASLTENRMVEEAALGHLQAAERMLAQTDGPKAGLTTDIKAGDEQAIAERMRKADTALDAHLRELHQRAEGARTRERDLARQVRELAAAQAVASPGTVPREDLTRLERALAEAGASGDLAEATRKVVASLKANTGKAEADARAATARLIATELVKAAEGDANLADVVSSLADANAGSGAMEASVREAVLKLAARKRALENERGRLAGEIETLRSERVAAVARAETAETSNRDEIERLAADLAKAKEKLSEAEAEVADFRARGDASSTHYSSEVVALRQELGQIRQRHQEQTSNLATLRQSVESSEARLKRQREELTKRLEERDNLIAEKDRTIDQLSAQRSDTKALEAKVQALTVELNTANERLRDLEMRTGDQAGNAVRSGDLAEAQRRATAERDQMRAQKRQLESELADAQGGVDELRTELAELKKLNQGQLEVHTRELAEERERNAQLKEDLRKLREEVVGLSARLRKRNEPGK